ncbi:hypothetical protein M3Y99_01150700 [Aphelenchoides fujianensis]|nr:hypothetical protein M3Y99_01150700 [Aphelenchoides fujianensis]
MAEANGGVRKAGANAGKKHHTNDHSAYNLGLEQSEDDYDTCSHVLIVLAHCIVILTFPLLFFVYLRIIRQYERAVIFRLGRLRSGGPRGPGLTFVIPLLDRCKRVDLRLISLPLAPQEVLTADSVTIDADATVYFHVVDPTAAVLNVENARAATRSLAQSTVRNVLGARPLSEGLSGREELAAEIGDQLNAITVNWGVKIERVEFKDLRLPKSLQRSMAAAAEASEEARAKCIAAEGESNASESLRNAARVLSEVPAALQLRYLQTMKAISHDSNSTILFPMPMDALNPLRLAPLPAPAAAVLSALPIDAGGGQRNQEAVQEAFIPPPLASVHQHTNPRPSQQPQPEAPPPPTSAASLPMSFAYPQATSTNSRAVTSTPTSVSTTIATSSTTAGYAVPPQMPVSTTVASANVFGSRYPQQNTSGQPAQRFSRPASIGTITEICTDEEEDDERSTERRSAPGGTNGRSNFGFHQPPLMSQAPAYSYVH